MTVRLEQLLVGQDGWHVDTDEPWRVRADDGYPVAFCGTLPGTTDPNPVRAERSADLIALAPDMGRLLIDMGEALDGVKERDRMGSLDVCPCYCPDWQLENWQEDDPESVTHHPSCLRARSVLARLDALGKDTAWTT